MFNLHPPNMSGKPVVSVAELFVLQTFNIAYDTGTFSLELERINLSGCYLIAAYTGARPAEIVDNERKEPKDGSLHEIFGQKAVADGGDGKDEGEANDKPPDAESQLLCRLLLKDTKNRGRPKALCYEDIVMMLVRHPVTGRAIPVMFIRFTHHKGSDNRPRPYAF